MSRENQWLLILFIAGVILAMAGLLITIQPMRVKLAQEHTDRQALSHNLNLQRQHLKTCSQKIARMIAAKPRNTSSPKAFTPLAVERVAGVQVAGWQPQGPRGELSLALDWSRVQPVLEYLATISASLEKLEIHRDKTRLLMQVTMNHANTD